MSVDVCKSINNHWIVHHTGPDKPDAGIPRGLCLLKTLEKIWIQSDQNREAHDFYKSIPLCFSVEGFKAIDGDMAAPIIQDHNGNLSTDI